MRWLGSKLAEKSSLWVHLSLKVGEIWPVRNPDC
jgi:hypothetical protein